MSDWTYTEPTQWLNVQGTAGTGFISRPYGQHLHHHHRTRSGPMVAISVTNLMHTRFSGLTRDLCPMCMGSALTRRNRARERGPGNNLVAVWPYGVGSAIGMPVGPAFVQPGSWTAHTSVGKAIDSHLAINVGYTYFTGPQLGVCTFCSQTTIRIDVYVELVAVRARVSAGYLLFCTSSRVTKVKV